MTVGSGSIALIGRGTVTAGDPTLLARNLPSFYADPAAWMVNASAGEAIADCTQDVLGSRERVAVVVMSDVCTVVTMRQIAGSTTSGVVSPLRFAGANPGLLAGLPCITWGLRGPTLAFTMDPVEALPVAAAVGASWLHAQHASHVLLATYRIEGLLHVARCVVARSARAGESDDRGRLRHLLVPGS